MKIIELSSSRSTKVDDEDYEDLIQYNWSYDGIGYARRSYKNKENNRMTHIRMHRQIMKPLKHEQVDHINRDKLDNRRENLRICTNAENMRNNTGIKNRKYSKFKGVTKVHKKYWIAQITVDYKGIHLGYFKNEYDAAKAYNEAAIKYHGNFARLNILEEE